MSEPQDSGPADPERPAGTARPRRWWLLGAAGLPFGWLSLRAVAALPPAGEFYGRTVFPPVRDALRRLAAPLPFSLAETLLVFAAGALAAALVVGFCRAATRRARWGTTLLRGAQRLLALAGVLYVAFLGAWGLNYAREPLSQSLGLEDDPARPQELVALAEELAERAALERDKAPEDGDGVFRLGRQGRIEAANVGAALRELAKRHPALAGLDAPDPLLRFPGLSPLLTRLGITGIWSPFTAEAHVNGVVPDVLVPFTACHEASHGCGVTREDEASFVAYLAGRRATSLELRYSALFCAWRATLGQLARVDRPAARELLQRAPAGMRRDARAVDEYWTRHDSWATDVARHTNDAYLRSQGEARGVRSYGGLVGLLLAERRLRGSDL